MTKQDNTQYINSLSMLELKKLAALIACELVKREGATDEHKQMFKDALTELAAHIQMGVKFH